ncbi:hypothetical protein BDN70DRAFT_870056 [Pholiota conissans]|uniref:Exosome complex protein n=1 Tax=Pholiota conissans TaxID=109636 RepID=A0A9P5ZEZ8_9AGAR|nr:hypothetical protein BDN70DRAFT_870056 [Pholiota conissans]
MATGTDKVKAKLAALTASFDDLETLLEPLFAQTLPETLIGLEPIQQAKLQTVLPYLVYDLIFIYLKSKGIDPKTHPVISELDRIRQYFEKISNAENPPAKRVEIDKAAAGRFIKHAIAQAQWKKTAAETMQEDTDASLAATTSAPRIPTKITQKMRERAEWEKEVKEQDARGSDEDELEVFEGGGEDNKMNVDATERSTKGKGRETPNPVPSSRNKRRRAAIDPFTGLKEDDGEPDSIKRIKSCSPSPPTTEPSKSLSSTPAVTTEKAKSSKKSKKKTKKQ